MSKGYNDTETIVPQFEIKEPKMPAFGALVLLRRLVFMMSSSLQGIDYVQHLCALICFNFTTAGDWLGMF